MSPVALRNFRIILWALVAAAAIGATAMYLFAPPKGPTSTLGGGTYALVDQDNKPLDQTMLEGHPSLLFFGYTHCPDVCPTTLAEMSSWFETLGPDADKLKAYFVTVDPARDTPTVLGDYVGWTEGRVTGVTGSQAEIDKIIKAWAAVAEKVPGDSPDAYTMNHTAAVYLLNSSGQFEGTIAYGEKADVALGKIRKLLGKA